MKRVGFLLTVLLFSFITRSPSALPLKEYEVVKMAEGVYGFVWKDPLQSPAEGNSLFIINDNDVVVVDAGLFPSSTRRAIRELQKLTSKPVRYVFNTHFHDDHINGNFLFRELWPDVEFVSHRDTRTDIIELDNNSREQDIQNMVESENKYKEWLASGKDDQGKQLDEARTKRVQELVLVMEKGVSEYRTIQNAEPNLTYTDSLILHRGNRIIKFLWLGRGNTRGDGIVYLPNERIAATGDLFVYPVPFGIGSYYKEWIATLSRVDSLNADVLFPGHGHPQHDRTYLRKQQALLRSLVSEVEASVADGDSLKKTLERVTLREWKQNFSMSDPVKERAFDNYFVVPAVERAWRQAKGEAEALK
ncbi:MAG TPA: MBL fold metallo-hydrolase [Bacteroidota bacterium]|nr:MBL fold metallo-hydrolase [Bacteroidota bacterium]